VGDLQITLTIIDYTASRLRTPDKTRRLKPGGKIERDCASHIKSGSILLVKSSQQSTITDRATGINIINLR